MFQTILIPLDGSSLAEQALPLAVAIGTRTQAALRLALVHRQDRRGMTYYDIAAARSEQTYLDQIAARTRESSGMTVTTNVIEEGPVALGLLGYAEAVGADLIVLTTHGRGPASRFWLGSVADELLRQATVPVLVRRPVPAKPDHDSDFHPRRILVPLDGSATAAAALDPSAELGKLFGAELTLFQVVEPVPILAPAWDLEMLSEISTQARRKLNNIASGLRQQQVPAVETNVVIDAAAVPAILGAAESTDLIVLATHGRGSAARFFLGSVTDKVVRGASCPVLVVRHPSSLGGPS